MKTCYIFGAAPIRDYQFISPQITAEDTVICADGGYRHAVACGITPQWMVGDFDSNQLQVDTENVIQVRPEKDDTDMELAVHQGEKLGYTHFVIYGALGGRFDHAMANVQMLGAMLTRGLHGVIVDEQNELFMIQDTSITLNAGAFPYVSLFSISNVCEGVTLTGMKYPLTDYPLKNTSAGLGTSNEILDQKAVITVKRGMLLVIRSRDLCG